MERILAIAMPRRRRPPQEWLESLIAEPDGLPVRQTGIWTLHKLSTFLRYAEQFTLATRKAGGGQFVDAFAGPGLNKIRGSNEIVYGSPLVALRVQPPFMRCLLLDQDPNAIAALRRRVQRFDGRAVVAVGEANSELLDVMRRALSPKAPTLCLLDPQGLELSFSTLRGVAAFREGLRKTEQLILFPLEMSLVRVKSVQQPISNDLAARLDEVYGTTQWRGVYAARRSGLLTPEDAMEAYFNLYRDQLFSLGYHYVLTAPVSRRGDTGKRLYHLFFCTDDEAGRDIMEYVMRENTPLNPQLRLAML